MYESFKGRGKKEDGRLCRKICFKSIKGRVAKEDGPVRHQVCLDAALRALPGQDHQEAGTGWGQEQRGAAEQNEKSPRNPHRSSEESTSGSA